MKHVVFVEQLTMIVIWKDGPMAMDMTAVGT